MSAEGILGGAGRLELVLLGERELADLRQAARSAARELRAVERRAVEEVGELRAEARVVERELLRPRPGLDLIRRARPPPPRRGRGGSRAAPRAPPPGGRAGRRCGRGSARPSRPRPES